MSSTDRKGLFGPDRIRPGYADTEWSVWISGMDDILAQPDRATALEVAAETNAGLCDMYDGNPFTPVAHAVVLYYGHAWKRGDDEPETAAVLTPEIAEQSPRLPGGQLDRGEWVFCSHSRCSNGERYRKATERGWRQDPEGAWLCGAHPAGGAA